MRSRSLTRFLAAALLPCAALLSHAAEGPAKELAALEAEFEVAPQTKETRADTFKSFGPRYEAFAAAHPGTEEALTAKLRLLQFTDAIKSRETMNSTAAQIVDQILAEHPRSPQLGRLTELWNVLAQEKADQVYRALSDPAQPDAVKAAMLYFKAKVHQADKDAAKATAAFEEILAKYKDVPYRLTTYGDIADAQLHPIAAAALEVGKPAPEIVGKSPDGAPIKLSDLKGRVVVVDFFGDW